MKLPKKIFVISHEATYTGAPILLLNLLIILKNKFNIELQIFIVKDGDLTNEFSKVGKVTVFKRINHGKSSNILFRLIELIKSRFILFNSVINSLTFPLIFSNTLINGHVYRYFKIFKRPTLVYVHELSNIIQFYPYHIYISPFINDETYFMFPSMEVKKYLVETYKIDVSKIFSLNYFIPDINHISKDQLENNLDLFKDRNSLLICGMGVASNRKGTDLFIKVASDVYRRRKDVNFIWIGGFANSELESEYRTMLKYYNLEHVFHFTGKLPPVVAKKVLSNTNVLFLSSREDPYPLVVLEAAMFKIPSIVFRDGGGITDFVNNYSGWVVNDFDIGVVSDIVSTISFSEIHSKGSVAREYYKVHHGSEDVVISQFLNCINSI